MLQSMRLQRVGHDLVTEQQQQQQLSVTPQKVSRWHQMSLGGQGASGETHRFQLAPLYSGESRLESSQWLPQGRPGVTALPTCCRRPQFWGCGVVQPLRPLRPPVHAFSSPAPRWATSAGRFGADALAGRDAQGQVGTQVCARQEGSLERWAALLRVILILGFLCFSSCLSSPPAPETSLRDHRPRPNTHTHTHSYKGIFTPGSALGFIDFAL